MKNNRADGSKSRLNPAKNHTKKQENLFSFPPINKMEKKKMNRQNWNNGFHTLSKKPTTKQSKEIIKKSWGKSINGL